MSEFSPWLGLCHLRKETDDTRSSQQTLVAVWTDSVEGFEREVHFHTNTHGLQMILAEEVLPSDDWLVKHPDRKDAQRLAGKVSAKHPVEIGALGGDGQPEGEAEGHLHIEEVEGVEPLDSQFGVHPPKTVPDALYQPLFGQPDPTPAEVAQYGSAEKVPPLHTYAILDAAKVVNFIEMLEASGLEHRCLFKGKAAEEMRDVAPYVVRLQEDVDFTRNLFSHDPEQDVPWFMWDREPGIYVRSRGTLEEMWKHFRKFTKVQDEDGKWYYFRFWEPHTSQFYFSGLMNRPNIIAQWFRLHNNGRISALMTLDTSNLVTVVIRPAEISFAPHPGHGNNPLTHEDISMLMRMKTESHLDQFHHLLARTFPAKALQIPNDELRRMVYRTVSRMQDYGFRQRDHLFRLLSWELFWGPKFENNDPEGKLREILTEQREESERLEKLAERMRYLV